jgi:hypothetical protein
MPILPSSKCLKSNGGGSEVDLSRCRPPLIFVDYLLHFRPCRIKAVV